MRPALRFWFTFLFLLLVAVPGLAADKPADEDVGKKPGVFRTFFGGFFDDWTGWLMFCSLVGLVLLVPVYFYLKKKQDED